MGNDTEYKKETKYKLEDQEYVLDVLKEYYEQTIEDCRIIGKQKHLSLSLIIALCSSFYVLITQVFSSNTLITLGNISVISGNILSNSPLETFIFFLIIISLILFISMFYMAFSGFLSLTMHLPLMDAFLVKIEQLQRDIIFKKMGDIDLFSWNEIKRNKSNTFKDYLKQKFIPENIDSVNTDLNVHQIQIDITKRNILNDITKRNLIKTGKKTGNLDLDKEKNIAILTVDGIVLDQFNVKGKNSDFILYESEMKYRFRNLMPHSNVLNQSKKVFIISAISSLEILVIIWYLAYKYYHTFLFWL